jgi:oligopeptide/dipeptide ABC transporter ATP-binding protein
VKGNSHLLSVNHLSVTFQGKGTLLNAVDEVSFYIDGNETLGLVGESGCGKTTLSRAIVRLIPFQQGNIVFEGQDFGGLSLKALKKVRSRMQMIFQDPYASLNPRMTVFDALCEPLRLHYNLLRGDCSQEVAHLLELVGLDAGYMRKYPHEFSGGQRQRIAIARALAVKPALLIADEPVSALDVSIQAQIVNLFADLRKTMGLAMLFISHDLSVVRHLSDRIAVMFRGRIVEIGKSEELFKKPLHPYTRALLAAIPVADPDYVFAPIQPPAYTRVIENVNQGCPYAERCPCTIEKCLLAIPPLEPKKEGDGHEAACIRKNEIHR